MLYHSTRDKSKRLSSMEVIKQGISSEGGLFVPETIPAVDRSKLDSLINAGYRERAMEILSLYLTDYSREDLAHCIDSAYNSAGFDSDYIAPVVALSDGISVLELWHGPTCAFKDMALQILPYLMTLAAKQTGDGREILVLTATSGDTGKAAMEGFKDVPGTRIMVFYPKDGVSSMQRLQMVTQEGANVRVVAVEGNFDDAQSGVKRIFGDPGLDEILHRNGFQFSSANSINWGRLVPQIVYYFSAYLDLCKMKRITPGQPVNAVVPTGNFGNILAAYYAKQMGLPINRLICASNDNNVLTDFIRTGVYDRRRDFHKTISPSMDILISSNLERLLFELTGRDDVRVSMWMKELSQTGHYTIGDDVLRKLQNEFYGGYAAQDDTLKTIHDTFISSGYIMDPHTAVGKCVYDSYRKETGDTTETILVSTASPFKFPQHVLQALSNDGHTEYRHTVYSTIRTEDGMTSSKAVKRVVDGIASGEAVDGVVDGVASGKAVNGVVDGKVSGMEVNGVVDGMISGITVNGAEDGLASSTAVNGTAGGVTDNTSDSISDNMSDETKILQELSRITRMPIPKPLRDLSLKPVLHKASCTAADMKNEVLTFIKS